MAVAEAAARFGGRVVLRIAGYTTGSGEALLAEMIARYGAAAQGGVIDYVGQVSRESLLELAAGADAGLALMPTRSDDVNMTEMVGASNKAFDYMAAGLPLIVSDLPEWRTMYVDPGYGLAAVPDDADSLAAAISQLFQDPERGRRMGGDNRRKIAEHWNYDIQFRPVVEMLQNLQ